MLIFFVGTMVVFFSSTKRKVIGGILINFFVFLVPVFPLIVLAWFNERERERNYAANGGYYGSDLEQFFLYAEIGGALLLVVLLATYIGKIYRRWYSLPEH